MSNIKGAVRDFVIKLQEFAITFGARKRIQIMLEYIDTRPGDILLDVSGNTGKIREAYSRNCKDVVVLEPKHSLCQTNTLTRSWQVPHFTVFQIKT